MLEHPKFRESLRVEFASKTTDRSFDIARVMNVTWNEILEKTQVTLINKNGELYYRYTEHSEAEVRRLVRSGRRLLGLSPDDILKQIRSNNNGA